MSEQHASRREFVTGVGLGIAGLSIAGEAQAGGLFGRLLGRRRGNTSYDSSCDTWQEFEPKSVHIAKPYGFVVDHHTYWGLPIPGHGVHPQPYSLPDKATVESLKVSNIQLSTSSGWTDGDFTVFATRTPPLFHAYHHKTDEEFPPKKKPKFERRAEDNVIETDKFGDRVPLRGNGKHVLKVLFEAKYDGGCCQWVNPPDKTLPIAEFDTRKDGHGLWEEAYDAGYFETRRGTWIDDEVYKKVGPLGALWIVLLRKKGNNTQLGRLGGSYRLWHHLSGHHGMTPVPDGYKWNIFQMEDFHRFRIQIELSGRLNIEEKRCPHESICISFELTWT